MKNIAIIPARSGSKGLPNKNIKEFCGKPLMAYSIEAAQKSKCFDEIMVSTDSNEYAEIAKKYRANVPFFRSAQNSDDGSNSWDVVREVLLWYENHGKRFDTICLLQPTSPLRRVDDIVSAYSLFAEKNAEAVTSVCEVDHSPLWCMELPQDLSMQDFRKKCIADLRQKLPVYYRLNGAIYIRRVIYDRGNVWLLDKKEFAYIMPKNISIDIDCILDFKLAEMIKEKCNIC